MNGDALPARKPRKTLGRMLLTGVFAEGVFAIVIAALALALTVAAQLVS